MGIAFVAGVLVGPLTAWDHEPSSPLAAVESRSRCYRLSAAENLWGASERVAKRPVAVGKLSGFARPHARTQGTILAGEVRLSGKSIRPWRSTLTRVMWHTNSPASQRAWRSGPFRTALLGLLLLAVTLTAPVRGQTDRALPDVVEDFRRALRLEAGEALRLVESKKDKQIKCLLDFREKNLLGIAKRITSLGDLSKILLLQEWLPLDFEVRKDLIDLFIKKAQATLHKAIPLCGWRRPRSSVRWSADAQRIPAERSASQALQSASDLIRSDQQHRPGRSCRGALKAHRTDSDDCGQGGAGSEKTAGQLR